MYLPSFRELIVPISISLRLAIMPDFAGLVAIPTALFESGYMPPDSPDVGIGLP